jgi:glycosyltransferase EpsD
LQDYIEGELRKLGLSGNVRFMGWRDDMDAIYRAADMSVSTAISEGLPFNIIEAQLCGLPVAASRIRGHTDLIRQRVTGWLYPLGEPGALADAVLEIYRSGDRGRTQGAAAAAEAARYSFDEAFRENTGIYGLFMTGEAGNALPAHRINESEK